MTSPTPHSHISKGLEIVKVLKPVRYGPGQKYVVETVVLSDGTIATHVTGGQVHDPYFYNGQIRVNVRRNKVDKHSELT